MMIEASKERQAELMKEMRASEVGQWLADQIIVPVSSAHSPRAVLENISADIDLLYSRVPPNDIVATNAWGRIAQAMDRYGVAGYYIAARNAEESTNG